MKHINPALCLDFYKSDHRRQYPEGTTLVVSNLTPRSGKHANVDDKDGIIFFSLQYLIKEFLIETWNTGFFSQPKEMVLNNYKRRMDTSLGVDAVDVAHIAALHDLGYLPVEIRAVAEGTFVPIGVPCLTIHNTLPEFFWLTNYLETVLSAYLWLPCTSATTACNYKKLLQAYAKITGSPEGFVDFQGHDFSFRGMSSLQSALVSGMAHLLFFKGTDTVPAIDMMEIYYGANADKELIGCSVPATEHSVMCMGGELDEVKTFHRLITELYPAGIVSIVSDTWDFWNVITNTATLLKNEIMARDGKVVFRPDSGNPADIICGLTIEDIGKMFKDGDLEVAKLYMKDCLLDEIQQKTPHGQRGKDSPERIYRFEGKCYKIKLDIDWNRYDKQFYYTDGCSIASFEEITLTPEQKGAVECLWEIFGGIETDKGYKLLDSHIGLIYGDSITYHVAQDILRRLEDKGFASANVVLGIGSYTYQMVTRDTWGFAVKATYGIVNGEERNIYKNPKTDSGIKKSAKGLPFVAPIDGVLCLSQEATWDEFNSADNALQPVFRNGNILKEFTLKQLRETL